MLRLSPIGLRRPRRASSVSSDMSPSFFGQSLPFSRDRIFQAHLGLSRLSPGTAHFSTEPGFLCVDRALRSRVRTLAVRAACGGSQSAGGGRVSVRVSVRARRRPGARTPGQCRRARLPFSFPDLVSFPAARDLVPHPSHTCRPSPMCEQAPVAAARPLAELGPHAMEHPQQAPLHSGRMPPPSQVSPCRGEPLLAVRWPGGQSVLQMLDRMSYVWVSLCSDKASPCGDL